MFKTISKTIIGLLISVAVFTISAQSVRAACIPGTSPIGNYTHVCVGKGMICENTNECAGVSKPTLNLDSLNQAIFGGQPKEAFATPRGIISYLLPFLFTLAGLILFVMIIWGGFEMLTGAADPKSQEAGKQRITAGVIGFIIIFAAYWLAQLLQTIFGVSILG